MIVTLKGIDNEQFGVELDNIVAVQPVTDGVECLDGVTRECCAVKMVGGESYGVLGSAKATISYLNASRVNSEVQSRRLVEEDTQREFVGGKNSQLLPGPCTSELEDSMRAQREVQRWARGEGFITPRSFYPPAVADMGLTVNCPQPPYHSPRPRIGQNRTIRLTEKTVQELSRAVLDARKERAKPDGSLGNLRAIYVRSPFKADVFQIEMENKPGTQESCGYRLNGADYDSQALATESEVP